MQKIKYHFLPFPRVLVKILGRDELAMLLHIISFPPHLGCFYKTKRWLEVLEIGSTAFERAKQKLLFLNLITITSADNAGKNKNPSNIYRFNQNVECWRLTVDLFAELRKSSSIAFENKPFETYDDFADEFNARFPHLKIERQGRAKTKASPQSETTQSVVMDNAEPVADDKKYSNRKKSLEKLSVGTLAFEYEEFRQDIETYRNTQGHGFSDEKCAFLSSLHALYVEKSLHGTDEEKLILKELEDLSKY